MAAYRAPPPGFSLVELLTVLLIVAVLSSLAAPAFQQAIQGIRARSALDRLTVELYRARMLALESGHPILIELAENDSRCTTAITVFRTGSSGGEEAVQRVAFDLPGLCLRHSGGRTVVFDGRGMLRPPSRSFTVEYGARSDRVILSIAGRIRRTY
ncbi:MAG: GspH/FimT family pseudopilin [Gemmatimonadota bacterium]